MPISGIYGPDDFANRPQGQPQSQVTATPRATPARTGPPLPTPSLAWTPEIARATAPLYERVKHVIPPIEWPLLAPTIHAINELKRARGAVILAHNYQSPEIFHCVADIGGDSLQLAVEASKVKAGIIVQCGVHFMAETSKLLNPDKTVLIPDMRAGCSLAASITGADVRLLRERFPGVPVVAYVNTSAEVKAEVDICCTSSNAVQVVESLGARSVIFLPDRYLATYVASQTDVKIIAWKGACEVHERFTGQELRAFREADPSVQIIAHPECPPDVLAEADFTGSTAHMISWVREKRPRRLVMITECSMADNVRAELPDVEMLRPCNLCPHMKRITLANILESLLTLREEVTVDPALAVRARRSVERMINLKN
ncbi:quinolinate synthase NadA [Bradyrhizobium sp. 199]|uniref:quinolinate synthase NadA n=1 Tax=Bradyrhizobium sp. 199 TaxID=2782664 RepID=UPI001FF89067|nr:quinolinate synthase NadA [Bradyrhizobium sp. 199]MCK1362030.1 quinolinate synthase NadA [Bradyrhizobium sp. 199]